MTPDRWQQIEEIFQSALDLAPAERDKFVEMKSAGDTELKLEVEKLLSDFDSADDFIESPVWTDTRFLNSAAKNAIENSLEKQAPRKDNNYSLIGKRIGVYELKAEIGRGGMGAVYLAERADGEFKQKVAIKLIKRGMDTDFVLSRFRHERQILANLNHPNIVLLLDGGTTDDGLPYFVMDFVEGEPLHKYCERNNLNLRERLELFRQVCEAVDYAHRKMVVHRDLKPSNILVNKYSIPKLLDFGIAKLLDPEQANDSWIPTETHMRLMTPEYASPEQVSGTPITPASDIYSLGVLLYELVTGKRPYKFLTRAPHEVARVICEEDPIRPSKIGIVSDTAQSSKSKDRLDTEIDKIILKSLRKSASERYETAAALAEDLQLYLENSPVKAQFYAPAKKPKAVVKQSELSIAILPFKLFARSESETTSGDEYLGIGLADSLVMRLSGVKRLIVRPTSSTLRFGENSDPFQAGQELGVDFILNGHIRRVGERIRVTAQLLKVSDKTTSWAENFNEKFTDVLEVEDSISEKVAVSLLPYLTGEERRQIEKRGTNSPAAYEAFLRGRFNWSLQSPAGFARSIVHYQQAVEIDPEYSLAYAAIAEYYIFLGIHCIIPFGECAKSAKQAAEKAIRLDSTLAEGHAALGFSYLSFDLDWKKAEECFSRALEANPNSTSALFWRCALYIQTKRFDEAFDQLKRLQEIAPDSFLGQHMVAWVLYHSRRYNESIAEHRQLLKIEPNYAWGLQTYSWALRRVGEYDEAILHASKAVQLTGEDPFYITALAAAYADAGNRNKAEEILEQLTKLSETRFVSEYMLALVYCALDDKDKAFENLETSLATHDGWINWLGVEPQLDILRDDPRYEDLLRRTGSPLAKPEEINTPQPTTGNEKSIAVLPLKLFGTPTGGESDENEYLGIGLADALVTRLSNIKRLMVRPTSSVLPFGDSSTNPFQAGRELNVDYVLDGNIRRAGDRIRVTIQLLNVGDGSSRWAESFNERFTDVLEIEDTISEKVIKSLIPRLTGEEEQQLLKRGTNNAEAYEAYLKGRFHWNRFTPDGLMKAQQYFQTAIELDSNYALPYVGLADFYIWANIYGLIPSPEALPLAEKAAQRAIELDDKLGEAYASLGLTKQNRFRWDEAEHLYKKSLEYAPNYVLAHEWWAAQLVGHGRFEEGAKEIKITEQLDPLSLRAKTLAAWTLYQARYYEDALKRGQQIIELDANYPQGYSQIGHSLLQMGRIDEAIVNYQKFNQMIPNSAMGKYPLCHALIAGGRINEAEAVLEEVKTLAANGYVKPYFLAMTYAAFGLRDEAFAKFEQAFAEHEAWMLWFGTEPMLDPLRDDPRFDDLLRRMNLPIRKRKEIKSSTEESPKTDYIKSIAVLPLKLIGANEQDDEYLSIGLADAMITRLSKVNRLLVRPTSSILAFAKWDDPFTAGRQLNVDYILSGTIRKAGDRIRISTQLVEINTDATLWADKFNESFTDVLDLEDIVAEKVGTILIPKLTGEEQKKLAKRSTDNPQAFEAYLRGRYHFNLFTSADFAKAKDYFEQAIRLDHEYASPYIGLAEYYFALGTFGAVSPIECNTKAKEMARKALELDDTIGEAYTMIGSTYFDTLDYKEAERMMLRSLELNPNYPLGHVWISVLYTFCGRYDDALREAKRATELNPLSGFEGQHYAWILYHTGHFEEAIAKARQVQRDLPNFSHGLGVLSWILRQTGQIEESIEHAHRAAELGGSPWLLGNLAASYAKAGQTDKARELLQQLEESASRYVTPFCLALIHVHLGQYELALDQLEKALQTRDIWFNWITTEPQLDILRDNPRFNELLRKSNNPTAKTLIAKAPLKNTADEKSIAVLPLKVSGELASKETGEEFLSVGLTDALIMHLSQLRSFSVRPTSSVMRFAGKDTDSIKAGHELTVRYVLEGNINRTGNQLRVNLRLLDVSEGSVIWSEEFNHDSSDIFVLEDEISKHVAQSILPQISPAEQRKLAKRATENAEAYELYLRGRHHWNTFTEEGFAKAMYFYNQAVAVAPNFALVYAGIADYYNLLGLYSVLPFAESSAKAKEAAQKAISLDNELAEGYAALGFATIMHEFDWEATEGYLKKSILLNPNYVTGRIWYSFYLALIKKFDESLEQVDYALKLDPLNSTIPHTRNLILYFARRFDESLTEAERLIEKESHYALAQLFLSSLLWLIGLTNEAVSIASRAVRMSGKTTYTLPWLASAYAANRQVNEAKQILSEIENLSGNRHLSPCLLAMVYCNLKDYEKALYYLEKAWEIRDGRLIWIGVDPQFDALRPDERFQNLMRLTKNPLVL